MFQVEKVYWQSEFIMFLFFFNIIPAGDVESASHGVEWPVTEYECRIHPERTSSGAFRDLCYVSVTSAVPHLCSSRHQATVVRFGLSVSPQ